MNTKKILYPKLLCPTVTVDHEKIKKNFLIFFSHVKHCKNFWSAASRSAAIAVHSNFDKIFSVEMHLNSLKIFNICGKLYQLY